MLVNNPEIENGIEKPSKNGVSEIETICRMTYDLSALSVHMFPHSPGVRRVDEIKTQTDSKIQMAFQFHLEI